MVETGGWLVNKDGTQATADSPQNVQALTYVQGLLKQGYAVYPKQVDAGWGGEAFGKGKTAMAMEGNWIKGAMQSDYSKIKYVVKPLPAGPAGQGTLSFTQCWGISAKSKFKDQAIKFVEAMTAKDQQLSFAKAFGVMPSRQSAKADYLAQFPNDAAFIDSADFAQGPVNAPKVDSVLADFDSQLGGLATGSPDAILKKVQTNLSRGARQRRLMSRTRRAGAGPARRVAPHTATSQASRSQEGEPWRSPTASGARGHAYPGNRARERVDAARPHARRRPRSRITGPQGRTGWLFVAPIVVILGLFVLLPIVMALFVSFTKWNGQGSPFTGAVPMAGSSNYTDLFTVDGLARQDFMTSIRNNFYYVAARGAAADRARAGPRARRQRPAAEGQGLLPHRVLLPVGDQFGRDQRGVPVPVRQQRRGQRGAAVLRHPRPGLVLRPARPDPDHAGQARHRRSGRAAARADRPATSWACPPGTGSPGRASRCARSSRSSCGPPAAPSC